MIKARMAMILGCVLTLGVATVLGGLKAPEARAAFPGANGVIAFALNDSDDGGKGRIVTVSPSGKGLKTIYSEGYGGSGQLAPSYSPDGKQIVFETNGQGPLPPPAGDDLQVMNSDGSDLHSVPSPNGAITPAWGRSGQSIVYSSSENLFTVNLDTGSSTQITQTGATQPAWSARNQIAYVDRGDIYIIRATGGSPRRLTFNGGRQPSFFPSGRRIAFVRNVAKRGQIFVIDANGTHLRQITHMKARSTAPAVSPDGRSIAFIHDDGRSENTANTNHLWLMRSDGGQAHQVKHLPGDNFGLVQADHPSWQPVPR